MAITPTSLETHFLRLVNEARAKAGVDALTVDSELLTAARNHDAWMDLTDTFSHTGVNGTNPGDRMTAAGYGARGWGENIAWVSGELSEETVQQLHTNLMNSPGHYANIVKGLFEEIGIGLHQGTMNGRPVVFVTQNFGTPNAQERAEADDAGTPVANATPTTPATSDEASPTTDASMVASPVETTPVVTTPEVTTSVETTPVVITSETETSDPIPTSVEPTPAVEIEALDTDEFSAEDVLETFLDQVGTDAFNFDSIKEAAEDRIEGLVQRVDEIVQQGIDTLETTIANQDFTYLGHADALADAELALREDEATGVTYVEGTVAGYEFSLPLKGVKPNLSDFHL